ncbi:hypothetical protein [Polaribacter sp. Hel1_85]|uniref:hypothetical protein n=1 Tax=Polaribacter sp. Hel1_85 TaxID=1250005 RepID=UPI00052BF726|nr:hypothetical protein [Polaribacter sp. Hel1_85]KGL58427.1 hypothetical protein PHEL85_3486 [Polaribacter sp. Hel1_85]KGL59073.1 hypothetical protein PHEL85_3347 [Polaribacter sp. Hel1_85]
MKATINSISDFRGNSQNRREEAVSELKKIFKMEKFEIIKRSYDFVLVNVVVYGLLRVSSN